MHPRPNISQAASVALVAGVLLASGAAEAVCYQLPFDVIGDPWGCAADCGRSNPHRGVDFPVASGRNIPAVADGVVAVTTYSNCLGNVVVVRHADGMYSGYAHMLNPSSLAVGDSVTMGQTVGKVGSTGTCTTGPHLHLTMSDHQDGYKVGSTIDPVAYINARLECAHTPRGNLDSATCDGIEGWAQDEDTPDAAVEVDLTFDGAHDDPDAMTLRVRADRHREDLCDAIGSCGHGFLERVPLALRDGAEHAVSASALDTTDGARAVLAQAPRTFRCDPPPLPASAHGTIRRPVESDESFAAWGRTLLDLVPLDAQAMSALPEGDGLAPAPQLVARPDDARVFVRDADVLRPVASASVLQAWGFSSNDVVVDVVVAPDAEELVEGLPWPDAPFFARDVEGRIVMLDLAPPPVPDDDTPEDTPEDTPGDIDADVDNDDAEDDGLIGPRDGGTSDQGAALDVAAGCSAAQAAAHPFLALLLVLRRLRRRPR